MTNDTRKRITLRLSNDMYKKLKSESKKKGIPINALINEYMWRWSQEQDQPKA